MIALIVILTYLAGIVAMAFIATMAGMDRAGVVYVSIFWMLFIPCFLVYGFFEMVVLYAKTLHQRIKNTRP